MDEKHLETIILMHKSKMAGDCCASKFLRHSVDRKHLIKVQKEIFAFKFLPCSVDGPLPPRHLLVFHQAANKEVHEEAEIRQS